MKYLLTSLCLATTLNAGTPLWEEGAHSRHYKCLHINVHLEEIERLILSMSNDSNSLQVYLLQKELMGIYVLVNGEKPRKYPLDED